MPVKEGQQQQALCVYEKMAPLALDLLARVEPMRIDRGPPFSALHALAVDDGGGGAGVAPGPMPLCLKSRHVTMMVHANKIAA